MVRTFGSSASSTSAAPTAPRRGGRTGCAAAREEVGQLALLAQVRLPQVRVVDASPRLASCSGPLRSIVERRRRRVEQLGDRPPTQVGAWTPLVMPRIGWSASVLPGRVGGPRVELADRVGAAGQAQEKAVMSNCAFGSSVRPRPSSRSSLDAAMPRAVEQRSQRPAGRGRASKRSLPAETGVWIVNTLSRRTRRQRLVERRARRDASARARARRAGTPSGPR